MKNICARFCYDSDSTLRFEYADKDSVLHLENDDYYGSDFNYMTLSHYFNEEDNLYLKMTDDKHREEKEKEEEEYNRSKESSLEVKTEVRNIRVFDIKTNSARYVQWSGQDVLYKKDLGKDDEASASASLTAMSIPLFKVISYLSGYDRTAGSIQSR